jgi:hypothetical protein
MRINENLEVLTAIVCDDVRREWNGKDILVGVYGSGIKFDQIPNVLVATLWVELNCQKTGEFEFFLRVLGQDQHVVFQPANPVKLNVPEVGFSNVALPGIALQVTSTGKLQFQFSPDAEHWDTIRTLNVIVGPIKPIGA